MSKNISILSKSRRRFLKGAALTVAMPAIIGRACVSTAKAAFEGESLIVVSWSGNHELSFRQAVVEPFNAKLWQQAWQHLDTTLCTSLYQALDQNHEISLSLCSETTWRHYRPQAASWLNKLQRLIQPVSVSQELRALTTGVSAP